MHQYREKVRTDIWSDSLFTIPDVFNTLIYQSTGKKTPPRDPLHGPVTSLQFGPRIYVTVMLGSGNYTPGLPNLSIINS